MLPTIRLTAVLAGLVFLAHPGSAQSRIVAFDGASLWEGLVEGVSVRDAVLRAPAGAIREGPQIAGGGRFVTWIRADDALVAFDRIAGGLAVVPGIRRLGVSDPTHPRVFARTESAIVRVSASGTATLPDTTSVAPVGISRDGARLYVSPVLPSGEVNASRLDVLDAETGARLRSVALGASGWPVIAPDEQSAWVVAATSSVNQELRRYDLPSGNLRFAVLLPSAPLEYFVAAAIEGIDVARHRVFVSIAHWHSLPLYTFSGAVLTLESETGRQLASVATQGTTKAALDAGTGTLLAHSRQSWVVASHIYCSSDHLHRISATTGEELGAAAMNTGVCLRVAFASPPSAPVLNEAAVSAARQVTLSWTASPELTIGFTVEAGSAPGLADLATVQRTDGPRLVVPNVPPGTYYVRVRALNYIGASAASNEIVVTVP